MKKILCFLLVACLLPAAAFASVDLSGMTFSELVSLRDQIDLAIWNCQEWQQVEVPQGVWLVGENIPAGHWTIRTNADWAMLEIGTALSEDGKSIDMWESQYYHSDTISNPEGDYFDANSDKASVDYELQNGTYLIIDMGKVIFSPYAGKPELGFK